MDDCVWEGRQRPFLTHEILVPGMRVPVRVGIEGDPRLVHDPCSEKTGAKVFFITANLNDVIYKAPKT